MADTPCQRWRERRDSYRPAREPLDPKRYGVELVEVREAKPFVVRHHYEGSWPAARVSVGLFRARAFWAAELVGVAVFAVPAQQRTIPAYAPGARDGVVLSRLVLLDEVEANAETWMLARAFRIVRGELSDCDAVVSYSDPMRRVGLDGHVVLPGHVGTIYQAFNARYLGRGKAEYIHLGPDGRVVSRRALGKIRQGHRGEAYAYRQLLELGAPQRRPLEEGAAYVERALREGPFRRVRHPGNHVYGWSLRGNCELAPSAGPFPKLAPPAEAA
jgi:hypothetical protein